MDFQKTARLSDKQRLRIQTRHRCSIERFGYQPQALFWSSREIQLSRFAVLAEIFQSPSNEGKPWSVLDVGCGFADLSDYLRQQGLEIDYQGIDLSADMVQSAGFQYPGIEVRQGDIFDLKFATHQFDYVLLSGALNEVVDGDDESSTEQRGNYAKAVIAEMYRISRIGVAFNLLDARNHSVAARSDLQSFYPEIIIDYCSEFAKNLSWRDDYLDNDFTVFLTK